MSFALSLGGPHLADKMLGLDVVGVFVMVVGQIFFRFHYQMRFWEKQDPKEARLLRKIVTLVGSLIGLTGGIGLLIIWLTQHSLK